MGHHFSPVFYLSGWASPTVTVMRKVNGNVVVNNRYPGGTGFVPDGYRIDHVPEDVSQRLETAFMSPLDDGAAKELQAILSGDSAPRSAAQRSSWTRFVISLLFRHSEGVRVLKDHMQEMYAEAAKAIEPAHPGMKFIIHPAAPAIDASNMLADIIDNDRVGPTIFGMKWCVVNVPDAKHRLLTSDRPVVMPIGLDDAQAYIALPISPTKVFVAAYDDRFKRGLPDVNQNTIVKVMNRAVVAQGREYVWGTDNSQLEFVKKHFGTAPERPLITEAQRQEAIAAARGLGESNSAPVTPPASPTSLLS